MLDFPNSNCPNRDESFKTFDAWFSKRKKILVMNESTNVDSNEKHMKLMLFKAPEMRKDDSVIDNNKTN